MTHLHTLNASTFPQAYLQRTPGRVATVIRREETTVVYPLGVALKQEALDIRIRLHFGQETPYQLWCQHVRVLGEDGAT